MLSKKGHSLTMWVVLFAMVISALAVCVTPAKRGLTKKVMGLSNQMLWTAWGNSVNQDAGENDNQIGDSISSSAANRSIAVKESGGKVSVNESSVYEGTVDSRSYNK
jgi:hypothetical protein